MFLLQVGILVTSTYFFFYFVPYIWVSVDMITSALGKDIGAPGLAGIALAELLSTIVCLQTCVDPLLYTLPSAHFRTKIWNYLNGTGGHNRQVEPSSGSQLGDASKTKASNIPPSANIPSPPAIQSNGAK